MTNYFMHIYIYTHTYIKNSPIPIIKWTQVTKSASSSIQETYFMFVEWSKSCCDLHSCYTELLNLWEFHLFCSIQLSRAQKRPMQDSCSIFYMLQLPLFNLLLGTRREENTHGKNGSTLSQYSSWCDFYINLIKRKTSANIRKSSENALLLLSVWLAFWQPD